MKVVAEFMVLAFAFPLFFAAECLFLGWLLTLVPGA